MRKKVVRPEELISSIKPGSFLEVELAPSKYIYLRKLNGLSGYVYYDFLSEKPCHDVGIIAQKPILLTISLLTITDPKWPIVGILPLEPNWPPATQHWTVEPSPLTEEELKSGVIKPDTAYFLIDNADDGETKYIPAEPDDLRGLTKWTLYPPELVEEKLRLHYGLTPEGKWIAPIPLKQQPLW